MDIDKLYKLLMSARELVDHPNLKPLLDVVQADLAKMVEDEQKKAADAAKKEVKHG